MKRLLIALMAVALVLVAVSFAAAQNSGTVVSGVVAFQTIIPPGGVDAKLEGSSSTGQIGRLDVDNRNAMPIQIGVAAGSATSSTTTDGSASASYGAGGSATQAATYKTGGGGGGDPYYHTYQSIGFGTHGSTTATVTRTPDNTIP